MNGSILCPLASHVSVIYRNGVPGECHDTTRPISENAFHYLDSTWPNHKKRLSVRGLTKSNTLDTVTSQVEEGHEMVKKWIEILQQCIIDSPWLAIIRVYH